MTKLCRTYCYLLKHSLKNYIPDSENPVKLHSTELKLEAVGTKFTFTFFFILDKNSVKFSDLFNPFLKWHFPKSSKFFLLYSLDLCKLHISLPGWISFRTGRRDSLRKCWNPAQKNFVRGKLHPKKIYHFPKNFVFLKRRTTLAENLRILWYFRAIDRCFLRVFYRDRSPEFKFFQATD